MLFFISLPSLLRLSVSTNLFLKWTSYTHYIYVESQQSIFRKTDNNLKTNKSTRFPGTGKNQSSPSPRTTTVIPDHSVATNGHILIVIGALQIFNNDNDQWWHDTFRVIVFIFFTADLCWWRNSALRKSSLPPDVASLSRSNWTRRGRFIWLKPFVKSPSSTSLSITSAAHTYTVCTNLHCFFQLLKRLLLIVFAAECSPGFIWISFC